MIQFTWDPRKNLLNQQKHGVSFEEAQTVFYREDAILFFDEDHPDNEERFLLLGISVYSNVLVVIHRYIDADEIIRIISARKATKKEEKEYAARNAR